MKLKKKKRGRLIFTLCLLIVTILFSVGGLTIIKGVSAGSDKGIETDQDEISVNEFINSSYNIGTGSVSNRVPVKIESVEECVDVINFFLENKAYVVTSKGQMLPSAIITSSPIGSIDEISCDLPYLDWFAHETSGRAYWEEGYKMGSLSNSFADSLFNTFMDKSKITQLNKFYFIDEDVYFKQQALGYNFTKGFELPQETWDKIPIQKGSNKKDLKSIGYMSRYFRWDITKDTVKNATFTKKLSGYQLEFDLDANTAARDVYKRIVVYLPREYIPKYRPASYHYTISVDNYGNITSFTRNETIIMNLSVPMISGTVYVRFLFKYDFKVKDDNFKIELTDQFKSAITKAGYSY